MVSLINTRQFVANKQIKIVFSKCYHIYCISLENINQFIDKFTKTFYNVKNKYNLQLLLFLIVRDHLRLYFGLFFEISKE